MPTNKGSKKNKNTKKAPLSTKKASKPLKKQVVQKVSKVNADTNKKRPAKRKANKIGAKRVQTQYDIVRGIVADYCKRNYGRRCTRAESKEIYQALKLRYLDKERKSKVTLEDIKKDIDKVLIYKNATSPPIGVSVPMPYYDVVPRLYNDDGGFFKEDDTLIFDLTSIGEGKIKTPYAELPYAYKTDIYERVREWIIDTKEQGIIESDNELQFVYDADKSDEEKRIFVWKLSLVDAENKEQAQTSKEIKKEEEEKKRNIEYNKERAKEEIQEIKEDIDALAIEQERTKQEQEKTKQKEIELRQKIVDRQLRAMDLLEKGLITQEQFAQMISIS